MLEVLDKEAQILSKFEVSVAEICKRFELSDEAKGVLESTPEYQTSIFFLNHLIKDQQYPDAINLLAHGLPQREAIWWAYLCASEMASHSPDKQIETQVLELVKSWVYQPEERTRRALEPFPEKIQFKTPASWAALAVFWSGGSITPIDQPVLEAAPYLYAKAVAGAIMLAAVTLPEKLTEHYQKFLAIGLDIAKGGSGII